MTVAAPPFYLFAALVVGGAVAAVSLREPVHMAAALLAALVGVGLLFVTAGAVLLGLAEIVVWVAAAAVAGLALERAGAGGRRWRVPPRLAPAVRWWPAAVLTGVVLATAILGVTAVSGRAWAGGAASAVPGGLLHDPRFFASTLTALSLAALAAGARLLGRVDPEERDHDERLRARREREERARRRRDDRARAREQRAATRGGRPG